MRYPGGKGGSGVYQTIINLIPPHSVYIEAFAGGANIYERKARAVRSILLERDPKQANVLRSTIAGCIGSAGTTVINVEAVSWLKNRMDEYQGVFGANNNYSAIPATMLDTLPIFVDHALAVLFGEGAALRLRQNVEYKLRRPA